VGGQTRFLVSKNGGTSIGTYQQTPPERGLYVYGNTGIGTNTPNGKFHVKGISRLEGKTIITKLNSSNTYDYGLLVNVNQSNTKALSVRNDDDSGEMFTVWGNGIVNAKKIYAEEVEVRLDAIGINWPDYVFADDYKLRSLSAVEEFVNTHHHLPNVPSEKEIAEDGINLGKMNAILLEKVEELTLYVIELEKKVDALEK